jgi:hypothetical protein
VQSCYVYLWFAITALACILERDFGKITSVMQQPDIEISIGVLRRCHISELHNTQVRKIARNDFKSLPNGATVRPATFSRGVAADPLLLKRL